MRYFQPFSSILRFVAPVLSVVNQNSGPSFCLYFSGILRLHHQRLSIFIVAICSFKFSISLSFLHGDHYSVLCYFLVLIILPLKIKGFDFTIFCVLFSNNFIFPLPLFLVSFYVYTRLSLTLLYSASAVCISKVSSWKIAPSSRRCTRSFSDCKFSSECFFCFNPIISKRNARLC